ncbi:MAG: glutamate-1-semialdehyde-2,1-aminomutase [Opitutae bacterium]|nr:glutamate-1-semialdehyde-2,1-aminomutase [Opitutae bacterium]
MNVSNELFERAKKLIPGGVNSPVRAFRSVGGTPFFTKEASGCRLTTADDRELIDYVCTWGPSILGHNNPAIREAVSEALSKGTSFGTPGPSEVEMAERIVRIVPSVEKVRMCNSGTEATMSTIRLARGFTGRSKIIKFSGCYHGHVDSLLVKAGSGALTFGNPDSAGIPESFARETIVLPYNDEEAIRTAFDEAGEDIAAIILEPYPANCGLILPEPTFLPFLRAICDVHETLLIFDEVMTGFRVALGGVQQREGVTPDLTAMGKIIGGGLPVGAFGGRAEVMDHLAPDGPVYQAGTLSGNPLAMAAGIAALRILEEEDPYPRLAELGEKLADGIREAALSAGIALQVPQVGSMLCLFFSEDPVMNFEQAVETKTDQFKNLFGHALDEGVYLPPSAFETCFLSTAHGDAEIDRTIEVIAAGIRKL